MKIGAVRLYGPEPAGDAFGIWKVNPTRSRDPYPTSLTVRFEPPKERCSLCFIRPQFLVGRPSESGAVLFQSLSAASATQSQAASPGRLV
jgi:hypothetical protein